MRQWHVLPSFRDAGTFGRTFLKKMQRVGHIILNLSYVYFQVQVVSKSFTGQRGKSL